MRLIDADTLRKSFKKLPFFTEVYLYYARQLIDNAPTITPEKALMDKLKERPQGKWIETDRFDEIADYMLKCPKCNEDTLSSHDNYCPNCGARMEYENEREER